MPSPFLSSVERERKGGGRFEKVCLCCEWCGYFNYCLLCWSVAKEQQASFPNAEWLGDEITLSEGHLLIHHLCLNSWHVMFSKKKKKVPQRATGGSELL